MFKLISCRHISVSMEWAEIILKVGRYKMNNFMAQTDLFWMSKSEVVLKVLVLYHCDWKYSSVILSKNTVVTGQKPFAQGKGHHKRVNQIVSNFRLFTISEYLRIPLYILSLKVFFNVWEYPNIKGHS